MADPSLRLDVTSVTVKPGGQVQVGVTVTSTSDIVEGYRLTVLGTEPSRWAEVVPPVVDVYPGEEARAAVVFSPASGTSTTSGRFAFGVKAVSTESPDASAVVEGTVEVGAVAGLQAKIVPVTSRGRWRGRHVVRLENWGTSAAQLRVVAADQDDLLGFYVKPDVVDLPVGTSAVVRLTARARRPFLRGAEVRHTFRVTADPLEATPGPAPATPYGDPGRPVVDATLLQPPILSRGVVTLAGLVLVAAVAGGVWAWTRPQAPPGSLAGLGPPSAPAGFAVVSTDASSATLGWKPVDQIEKYLVQRVDPEDSGTVLAVQDVPGAQNAYVFAGLPPATRVCFKVRAERPNLPGPSSPQECGTTALAPASPSPSPATSTTGPPSVAPSQSAAPSTSASGPPAPPGGSPSATPSPTGSGAATASPAPLGGGQWVIVADFGRQDDSAARQRVDRTTKKLQEAGLTTAQTVSSDGSPGLQLGGAAAPLWLSVVGPYADQPATAADCPQVEAVTGQACTTRQPQPS